MDGFHISTLVFQHSVFFCVKFGTPPKKRKTSGERPSKIISLCWRQWITADRLANLIRMTCRTFSMALTAMRDLSLAFRTAELKSEKHGDQPHPNIVSCIVADVNSAGRTCSLPNKAVQWRPWNLCIPFFGPRHIYPPQRWLATNVLRLVFSMSFCSFFLLLLHQGPPWNQKTLPVPSPLWRVWQWSLDNLSVWLNQKSPSTKEVEDSWQSSCYYKIPKHILHSNIQKRDYSIFLHSVQRCTKRKSSRPNEEEKKSF